jgi:hypothetical protein
MAAQRTPPPSTLDPAAHAALCAVRRVLCATLPTLRRISPQLYGDVRRALATTEQALREGQRFP